MKIKDLFHGREKMVERRNVDIHELLPIGSIVIMKEGEQKLMIVGVMLTDEEDDSKEYDYMGIIYPEGYMGPRFQYLFYHEDIDQILFRGYEDDERKEFVEKLAALYQTTQK